jgi:hypothetical protein
LFICAIGCGRKQEDLSPDGKTFVFANNDGVIFRDSAGIRPDLRARLGRCESPSFSPDGRLLAVQAVDSETPTFTFASSPPVPVTDRTLVLAQDGHVVFSVRGIGGPYAWRPDGSEIVGFTGVSAAVIHIPSHQVVRTYSLPAMPEMAVWIGDGRDLAVGGETSLSVVHAGVKKEMKLEGAITDLMFDQSRQRLMWAEITERDKKSKFPQWDLCIKACEPSLKSPIAIMKKTLQDNALDSRGRHSLPSAIKISPDGSQLAVAGLVDVSRPGLLDRYMALGGFNQSDQTPDAVKRQLHDIAGQLKYENVCTTIPLSSGAQTPVRRFAAAYDGAAKIDSADAYPTVYWTNEGHDLAVVTNNRVHKL